MATTSRRAIAPPAGLPRRTKKPARGEVALLRAENRRLRKEIRELKKRLRQLEEELVTQRFRERGTTMPEAGYGDAMPSGAHPPALPTDPHPSPVAD